MRKGKTEFLIAGTHMKMIIWIREPPACRWAAAEEYLVVQAASDFAAAPDFAGTQACEKDLKPEVAEPPAQCRACLKLL